MIVHAWDPYHGDPNHRFQNLGRLLPRRVPRPQWSTFASIQPAIYGNGIFSDNSAYDVYSFLTRDQRAQTSIVNNDRREIARRAFSHEPELKAA